MSTKQYQASRSPLERSVWRSVYRPALSLTAAMVAVGAVAAGVERQDPISTFKSTFTAEGECLSGTPFDPNNPDAPASIFIEEKDGYTRLVVLPQAPNYTEPSVLDFNVSEGEGIFTPPVFTQNDAVTSIYVSGLDGCPPLPQW